MYVQFSPSAETPGLKIPKDVFNMQNTVSNNLNTFQTKYSRYVRCQNENTAKKVDPPCALTKDDSFSSLTNAYVDLYTSMNTLEKVYDKQSTINGKTTAAYKTNSEEMDGNYQEVVSLRKDLDKKLKYIQENSNIGSSPALRMLNSRILINTLLVILLIYLVYVLIFDLIA
jgi:hypothetical protein